MSTATAKRPTRPVSQLAPAVGIASFPRVLAANPYQRLLYGELAREGLESVESPEFNLRWLLGNRDSVGILHFHWPDAYYRVGGGAWRAPLSWLKLVLFAVRLAAARALGYRIAWTVHQIVPHVAASRGLDRTAARVLARAAHVLIAHDPDTAVRVREELSPRVRVAVLPHGSYVGVYPEGRSRDAVRAELGADRDTFVFLAFGQLRADKELETLLDAFALAPGNALLVVAGPPEDVASAAAVTAAAEADPRIVVRLGYVPDEQVAELFGACDAAVLPRGDGGTSGSLVLALSFGLAPVAAAAPAYVSATDGGRAAWLFLPGDPGSLALALCSAAGSPLAARAKGRAARELAEARAWRPIAQSTAVLLRACAPRPRRDRHPVDVLLVCSSGGHLLQLVALRGAWAGLDRAWVTLPTGDASSLLAGERVFHAHGPTSRNVPNLLRNLVLAFRVVAITRPRVVLSTGAAIALPFALAARLAGIRFVYVESISRTERPSLSCRLVAPFADRVYTQWPELAGRVRRSRYAGGVIAAP